MGYYHFWEQRLSQYGITIKKGAKKRLLVGGQETTYGQPVAPKADETIRVECEI